jgi:hypothetical protein
MARLYRRSSQPFGYKYRVKDKASRFPSVGVVAVSHLPPHPPSLHPNLLWGDWGCCLHFPCSPFHAGSFAGSGCLLEQCPMSRMSGERVNELSVIEFPIVPRRPIFQKSSHLLEKGGVLIFSPGLYGGLYGQNLPYKFKNSYGDFQNRTSKIHILVELLVPGQIWDRIRDPEQILV